MIEKRCISEHERAFVLFLSGILLAGLGSADAAGFHNPESFPPLEVVLDGEKVAAISGSWDYGGQKLFVQIPASYKHEMVKVESRSGYYHLLGRSGSAFTQADCALSHSEEIPVLPGERLDLNVAICKDFIKPYASDVEVWVRSPDIPVEGEMEAAQPGDQSTELEEAPTSEKYEETVMDLGLIHYAEAPKTWTIDVPQNFNKVEAGVYGKEGGVNGYGGWEAYLEINGNRVWNFVRHDSQLGGIFYDYIMGKEVQARDAEGRYLDVTSLIKPGENTITFYHYTEGDAGVKIKIWRQVNPGDQISLPEPAVTADLGSSDRVSTAGERALVQRVLDAETALYDSMWDIVALDRDGYIFTYSESFADIILSATGTGQEDEMDEDRFGSVWDLFIDQVWSSTESAMSAAGLEVPSEISAFLGSDIVDVSLKQAKDIESETAEQFLDEEKAKYVMWGGCYIGLRTLVYADDLKALTKEHQTFQAYWMNKSDDQLMAAFGTRESVDRFIEILNGWSQRFRDKGLKEYKFKSDTLGDSAEGQVARATWEASQGVDSYDSRTQAIGRRVINKFPRAMIGVNYFLASKSIWNVIDVIGKAVPGGSKLSLLVNDIGFNGGCLAAIVLAQMAMEQDIDQMSDILEELNFYSEGSSEDPGEFGIFVDEYYGQSGV